MSKYYYFGYGALAGMLATMPIRLVGNWWLNHHSHSPEGWLNAVVAAIFLFLTIVGYYQSGKAAPVAQQEDERS